MERADNFKDIADMVERHADMVWRICYLSLGNVADAEDAFQDVFLRLLQHGEAFENELHEKAWICRVAFNRCKDIRRSFWKRRVRSIEGLEIPYRSREQGELIEAVRQLPADQRMIIYMHYYENMTVPEISEATGENPNTIYTRLRRAKARLKTFAEAISHDG